MIIRSWCIFGLAFCLATATFTAAVACSYGDNTYDRVKRKPLHLLATRSENIELVQIAARGEPLCPPRPPRAADDEVWDQWTATVNEACVEGRPPGADLTATVLERFKGSGDLSFAAFWEGYDGRPKRFTDLRTLSLHDAESIRNSELANADDGHHDAQFWLQGDRGFNLDRTDSCGGNPILVTGQAYVVFRNINGDMLTAEPVTGTDDALVVWLRQTRGQHPIPPARTFTAAEALRASSGLALVRIERCEDTDEVQVFARQLRGSLAYVFPRGEEVGALGEQLTYYLDEWLEIQNLGCEPRDILVVEVDGRLAAWTPPMPAVIHNDSVLVAELFPDVALVGEALISVDEAFRAFESAEAK